MAGRSPFVPIFLITNFILRIVLSVMCGQGQFVEFLCATVIGIFNDFIVLIYLAPLIMVITHFISRNKISIFIWYFVVTFFCIFTIIAEFLFWQEFENRFNFIAVDYLIYTKEVIGNITESYNVSLIILVTSVIALIVAKLLPIVFHSRFGWMKFGLSIVLGGIVFGVFDSSKIEFSNNRYANEISKNGLYELFSAFRHNDLPFERFYVTENQEELTESLRKNIQLDEQDSIFLGRHNIARQITSRKKSKKLNIVLIMVESLSASFLEHFGNCEKLTPNIDRLFERSMVFTNVRAAGTRTVYGLAAVNLSIPPIPGNSIIRRRDNENLSTIGSILKENGYACKFVYGGFGYFDNMNYFFENNDYEIIDRNKIDKKNITFANNWGICDEDLFDAVIREADKSAETKQPFFLMVMTTSNHRPFSYPDGKIDIPSKTGRAGGVKYTDFAIGQFLEQAKDKGVWFEDTIFVITADHTAGSAGKLELDPSKYHIPLIIFAPKHIAPQAVNTLASQIDIGPTLLALLNLSYESKFFGHDILATKNERAFISNYQRIGYLNPSKLIIFKPINQAEIYKKNGDEFTKTDEKDNNLQREALQYFQSATKWRSWNKKKKEKYSTEQKSARMASPTGFEPVLPP